MYRVFWLESVCVSVGRVPLIVWYIYKIIITERQQNTRTEISVGCALGSCKCSLIPYSIGVFVCVCLLNISAQETTEVFGYCFCCRRRRSSFLTPLMYYCWRCWSADWCYYFCCAFICVYIFQFSIQKLFASDKTINWMLFSWFYYSIGFTRAFYSLSCSAFFSLNRDIKIVNKLNSRLEFYRHFTFFIHIFRVVHFHCILCFAFDRTFISFRAVLSCNFNCKWNFRIVIL